MENEEKKVIDKSETKEQMKRERETVWKSRERMKGEVKNEMSKWKRRIEIISKKTQIKTKTK